MKDLKQVKNHGLRIWREINMKIVRLRVIASALPETLDDKVNTWLDKYVNKDPDVKVKKMSTVQAGGRLVCSIHYTINKNQE